MAFVGAGLNVYFTRQFALSLWSDDFWASQIVAIYWQGALLCLLVVGLECHMRGLRRFSTPLLVLAAIAMVGSTHAAAAYIGQVDMRANQQAVAVARSHHDTEEAIAMLQRENGQNVEQAATYQGFGRATSAAGCEPANRGNSLARSAITVILIFERRSLLAFDACVIAAFPHGSATTFPRVGHRTWSVQCLQEVVDSPSLRRVSK